MLLRHLSPQVGDLLDFTHDGIAVRIVSPQQFAELDAVQLQIGASLYGGFLRIHGELMQAANLLVRQTQFGAHAGIVRQMQKSRSSAESVSSVPPTRLLTPKAPGLASVLRSLLPLPTNPVRSV